MNLVESPADRRTAELVRLARRELHGDVVLSDDVGFARLQARLAKPKAALPVAWLLGAVGLAAATALAVLISFREQPRLITFEVAGGKPDRNGHIIGGDGTRIRFSDGSEAALARGADAQIQHVTEHGAEVVLSRGSMRVHVAKKPLAAWNVTAGPYNVHVTGTEFNVSWSKQRQAFDLRMETGAVIVTGPLAAAGIVLKAGQHMFGGVAEGRLTVEGGESASPPPKQPPALAVDAPVESPSVQPARAATTTTTGTPPRAAGEPHVWTRQVAQGRFDSVLEDAERRGMDRTLAAGSLEELSALADAARYAGRASIARRVLLAERERFSSSAAARDAAFFLGRIAEDGGGGALEWYERYLNESPRGAYASQALGRKMMLLYKQGGRGLAEPVAIEYLGRYPSGPYAAAARKIDQEYPSTSKP